MLFFYIRHGEPIYEPDSLTPLGERQAQALAKRLALCGVDKIFASTSNRAIQTAKPTCELLKKEMVQLDFANEKYAYNEFAIKINGKSHWVQEHPEMLMLFASEEIRELGFDWYTHSRFQEYNFQNGLDRIGAEADRFFRQLGYEHIKGTGKYEVIKSNDERVAMFAHAGFGITFLSSLLDIPYPTFSAHFDMQHSGMTVIEFREYGEYAIPKVLTYSSDSHIYHEGLPTNYCGRPIKF